MRIEDDELRNLYQIESTEQLQTLEQGLLHLTEHPADLEMLAEVFRAAHNLKGAARMLGLAEVASIAHYFEDLLGACRRSETALSAEKIDQLSERVDTIRRLVQQALTGEPAEIRIEPILNGTAGPDSDPERPGGSLASSLHIEGTDADKGPNSSSPDEKFKSSDEKPATLERFRIDTIRVPTGRIDTLMTHAGELAVTTIRIGSIEKQISDLVDEWEESTRLGGGERFERLGRRLDSLKETVSADHARLSAINKEIEGGIRKIRLLPLSTLFQHFPRMVRDLAGQLGKEVCLIIEGSETSADKRIIEELKDPLMHMIRNAIDHGIEPPNQRVRSGKPDTATLHLRARRESTSIVIEVEDDGRGLDTEAIRRNILTRRIRREEEVIELADDELHMMIFTAGLTTRDQVTDMSGRGIGLDVVRKNVEQLKGSLKVESTPGAGCLFTITLPVTLATARVIVAQAAGYPYAFPIESVRAIRSVSPSDLFRLEGRDTLIHESRPIGVFWLRDLLELSEERGVTNGRYRGSKVPERESPCIIMAMGDDMAGIRVDSLLDEQEVVLKPLGTLLRRVRNLSGATILGSGEICLILNPSDLVTTALGSPALALDGDGPFATEHSKIRPVVLLVEDSITTRTQERRILESSGYEVVTAVDGVDALNKLTSRAFQLLVSDVEMPNMDGFRLTETIRSDHRYDDLPIVLVTSLSSDEDRKRGVDAGANAYLTKAAFDQKLLLETLERLI